MSLLRDLVLNLPGIPALKSCSPLCSKDVEVDFFNNILHLQVGYFLELFFISSIFTKYYLKFHCHRSHFVPNRQLDTHYVLAITQCLLRD